MGDLRGYYGKKRGDGGDGGEGEGGREGDQGEDDDEEEEEWTGSGVAATAGEAIEKMLRRRGYSKKINYDILKSFDTRRKSTSSVAARSTTTTTDNNDTPSTSRQGSVRPGTPQNERLNSVALDEGDENENDASATAAAIASEIPMANMLGGITSNNISNNADGIITAPDEGNNEEVEQLEREIEDAADDDDDEDEDEDDDMEGDLEEDDEDEEEDDDLAERIFAQ